MKLLQGYLSKTHTILSNSFQFLFLMIILRYQGFKFSQMTKQLLHDHDINFKVITILVFIGRESAPANSPKSSSLSEIGSGIFRTSVTAGALGSAGAEANPPKSSTRSSFVLSAYPLLALWDQMSSKPSKSSIPRSLFVFIRCWRWDLLSRQTLQNRPAPDPPLCFIRCWRFGLFEQRQSLQNRPAPDPPLSSSAAGAWDLLEQRQTLQNRPSPDLPLCLHPLLALWDCRAEATSKIVQPQIPLFVFIHAGALESAGAEANPPKSSNPRSFSVLSSSDDS